MDRLRNFYNVTQRYAVTLWIPCVTPKPLRRAPAYWKSRALPTYTSAVSEKDVDSTLDALVGAALRGLVESGASANAIGAFAVSYRAEVAGILGLSDRKPEPPNIDDVVVSAMQRVLDENGVILKQKRRRKAPEARSVRFTVMVSGRKTSIAIPAQVAQRLIQQKGGRQEATKYVESFASLAPPNVKSRSRWVVERILTEEQQPPGVLRH